MPSLKEVSRSRALLSKENKSSVENSGESSFRVYYGATGAAVPFMWESQPGTPKHPMFTKSRNDGNDLSLPPLTPPPSYTTSSSSLSLTYPNNPINNINKSRKARFFSTIFSSISRKNNNSHVSPTSTLSSPLSWSTSSSSSSSLSLSLSSPRSGGNTRKNNNNEGRHRRSVSFCSSRAKSPLFGDEDHDDESIGNNKVSSTMCFGFKKNKQGCYSMQEMKDAIFSIKGSL